MTEEQKLNRGIAFSFLFFALTGLALSAGALGTCNFIQVEANGPFLLIFDDTADGGGEQQIYNLGLFQTNVNFRNKVFDKDFQQDIYTISREPDGCQAYTPFALDLGVLRAPQRAAIAFAIISMIISGLLFFKQFLDVNGCDGEGRRITYPAVSSLLFLLSGIFVFLELLFLKHVWCNEEYGTCTNGPGVILAILAGVCYFICAGICFSVYRSSGVPLESNDDEKQQTDEPETKV